ncbi:MAG: HAMP domain-containing histidine kinase [Leptolyngbya sp. SIO1E4]|nr:HAMP domain-containing histidine kinase [Leptolyngbya sp. SIO1E4]
MLLVVGVSIPIFRFFLFAEIDARVREDLLEEFEEFQVDLETWDAATPDSEETLLEFVDTFLDHEIPEDDNYHVVILEEAFYRSNPMVVPDVIGPDSDLMQQWARLQSSVESTVQVSDPAVGSVVYRTQVLEINDVPQGLFVAVHLSAGERVESLAAIYVFVKVAAAVVVASFLLAWLGSRQLLKPVQQLAETAKKINETNLSDRLSVKGSGELSALATTFNTMMDRVQNAFTSQRNFINDAGHELRTPITIVQGHLELMEDDPEEQQETLELVMDELDRMGRFVNDMVLLAKSERPDFLLLEAIDLKPFTEAIFSKVTALADRDWQLASLEPGRFVADRQRITGALINLASNATQYTQTEDMIEIGSAISQKQVRLWVRDTGEGISPDDQQRIFDRFARAAKSYRRSEGAGLGLAIVRAIAEAHGGHVELISQPGVGSTFTLVLPLQ